MLFKTFACVFGLILLAASISHAETSVILADGKTALNAALKSAHAGDTIQLAAGNYSDVAILGVNFNDAVTITSKDPTNKAVFFGLRVVNSSGLHFSNLELSSAGVSDPYYAFRVANAQNIIFSDLSIHGRLDSAPSTQLSGFYIVNCSNITISNSELYYFDTAIAENRSTYATIANNFFHNLSKGGVEMGGNSHVTVSNNVFTDFDTAPRVHGDAIQLFTAGTKESGRDIVIADNLFYRSGGMAIHGIFVGDEVGTLPYIDVTIVNNAIIGASWNSITLGHASGNLRIENNVMATWSGTDVEANNKTTRFLAWLRLGDLSGAAVTETGNQAQAYVHGSKSGLPPLGNALIGEVTDGGAALLRAWRSAHPGAGPLSKHL